MNPVRRLVTNKLEIELVNVLLTMWEASFTEDQGYFLIFRRYILSCKAIDYIETPTPADFGLKALGEFSWEKCSPTKGTYAGKTVIIGGDDDLWFRRTSNFYIF
jgi:hypothetical protein